MSKVFLCLEMTVRPTFQTIYLRFDMATGSVNRAFCSDKLKQYLLVPRM